MVGQIRVMPKQLPWQVVYKRGRGVWASLLSCFCCQYIQRFCPWASSVSESRLSFSVNEHRFLSSIYSGSVPFNVVQGSCKTNASLWHLENLLLQV